MSLILNIPIFLLGFREFSLKFILTSIIGVIIYTLSLRLTEGVEISINDPMLASIFGGVLAGFSTLDKNKELKDKLFSDLILINKNKSEKVNVYFARSFKPR